jgi:hypothetical protein
MASALPRFKAPQASLFHKQVPTGAAAPKLPLRQVIAPVLQKSRKGIDKCLNLRSQGSTTMSQGLWHEPDLDVFECNGKQSWMDIRTGYCHLCQEPIGSSLGIHMGDRDHMCLALFLHFFTNYPRHWLCQRVLQTSETQFPRLNEYATMNLSMDHLHTVDDARRRADLESILWHLTDYPHRALSHVLQGKSPDGFWYSGERMFKVNITRIAAVMFPPMNNGILTTFTHKCWGRSNLERMYDALNIATIQRHFGCDPKTEKEPKAFYMRRIFWELESASIRDDIDEVTHLLIETAKRRLSFECIFLQSMQYMNRVQEIVKLLDYPTPEELSCMNVT